MPSTSDEESHKQHDAKWQPLGESWLVRAALYVDNRRKPAAFATAAILSIAAILSYTACQDAAPSTYEQCVLQAVGKNTPVATAELLEAACRSAQGRRNELPNPKLEKLPADFFNSALFGSKLQLNRDGGQLTIHNESGTWAIQQIELIVIAQSGDSTARPQTYEVEILVAPHTTNSATFEHSWDSANPYIWDIKSAKGVKVR